MNEKINIKYTLQCLDMAGRQLHVKNFLTKVV